MTPDAYQRPASLDRALDLLAQGGWTVLAGGTDIYPAHVGKALTAPLLDVGALTELRGLRPAADGGWSIGALTTWSDLVRHADGERQPAALFAGLVAAAREIGGIQIQNQATLGGNLCNASPAADGVPMLAALDAQVELRSGSGVRCLPIGDFVLGNRRTARRPDELLTAILIPRYSDRALSRFRKLGHRRYLVISIASVGVALDFDEQSRVQRCGIAIGSCAVAARRLPRLEQALMSAPRRELAVRLRPLLAATNSLPADPATVAPAAAGAAPGAAPSAAPGAAADPLAEALSPIDDIRGTAAYRLHAARELLLRSFEEIADVR